MGLACDTYLGKRKIYTEFLQINLKEIHHLKHQGIDTRMQLKQNLKKQVGGEWTGLVWLSLQTSGRLLMT
jgi:hypothetical protein